MKTMAELRIDRLNVHVYEEPDDMGRAAASAVAKEMRRLGDAQDEIVMAFAAAPSQIEFLKALCETPGLPWDKVLALHLDEYIGLDQDAPQRFSNFLKEHLFDRVPLRKIHYLDPDPEDPAQSCTRYGALLRAHPLDIACLGIGENGHLAFNDPPVADFKDDKLVKVVDLDERCRIQQVNDECFADLSEVPRQAVTLTIPALMSAKRLFVVVPGARKAHAVFEALTGVIHEPCPASILRTHPAAELYLDWAAAQYLDLETTH